MQTCDMDERTNDEKLNDDDPKARVYQIKSTGYGSDRYGNCEQCGKHCSEVFMQQWRFDTPNYYGWMCEAFGHLDCLRTGYWKEVEVVHR